MRDVLAWLAETNDFATPWQRGHWSEALRWIHVGADVAIWSGLAALTIAFARLISRRTDLPFRVLGWLFVIAMLAFAALCLVDLTLFWQPWYRLSGAVKAIVGGVTCLVALCTWVILPRALKLPNPMRINELLQIEIRERERANERSRLVVEMAPNAIVMAHQSGRIVQVNAKAEQYFGYHRSCLIGKHVDSLLPQRLRELPGNDVFAPRGEPVGTVAGLELCGLRQDGSEFPIEIAVQPIVTERDVMVLIAISDVTLQKEAEAALKKSARDLQRSNNDLSQFAYVASHDLKEPLRKVSSFCQLLKERCSAQLNPDGMRYVDYAVDGAQRMQALITALLELSQLDAGDRPLSPVDAGEALQRAIDNLQSAIDDCGAEVQYDRLPMIAADLTQLTQLFQNLLGNAIKFRGDRRPVIRIDAAQHAEEWLFSVRDNGIGIAAANVDRIFGIFQRLHTREEYPGTGIGLAVCKRIVERFGGRIWVESVPGEGTTFHFTTPRREFPTAERIESGAFAYAT